MNRASTALASVFALITAGCSRGPSPVQVITVSGKVMNGSGPVAGAKVMINARPVVATAADGTFTVSNVAVPYDALVGDTTVSPNQAFLYKGLKRTNPVLGTLPSHTATVSGTLTGGGGFPMASNTAAVVAFGSDAFNVPLSVSYVLANADGTYSIPPCASPPCGVWLPVTWRGDSPVSGTLHALQWTMDSTTKLPTTYTGHGSMVLDDLVDKSTFSGGNITLTSLPASSTSSVSGDVQVPDLYSITSRWVEVYFAPNTRIPVGIETGSSLPKTFSYNVPSLAGASATVWVNAVNGAAWSQVRQCGIAPGTSGVSLSVPTPPGLVEPADAATNVTAGTTFSWSAFPSGGAHALFLPGGSGKPALTVFTEGTQVSLPDLATVGLSWPASASYTWYVSGFAPLTIDDWADPIIQTGCSFTTGFSATRNFTTAP